MKKLLLTLLFLLSISVFAKQQDSVSVNNLEKTDEALAQVVKKALSAAEKTGDFVISQAPDLLQEFYTWQIVSSVFWIIISAVIFIAGRYIPYSWGFKTESGMNDEYFMGRWYYDKYWAVMFFVVTTIASVILFICSVYDLIFITCAPKLYLINYFLK